MRGRSLLEPVLLRNFWSFKLLLSILLLPYPLNPISKQALTNAAEHGDRAEVQLR